MHTKFWSGDMKGRNHSEDNRRCEGNIRMYLRETGWEGVDWMHPTRDRERGNEPSGS